MNELRLLLDNFQSISSGELVFKTGLNFIIGQSNSGKTATFRALKACLLNPAGSQRFIKKGHSSTTVTMYYNGNQIEWKRSQKDSSYVINGESYLKTGKSDTFKILDDNTGFVQGEDSTLMNMEEELQLPFPFGLSKSDLFKLYENVFCVSDSATILKSAKANEDEIKNNITLIDNELMKNKRKLEELESFKNEINLVEMNSLLDKLSRNKERVETLQDGLIILKKITALHQLKFPLVTYSSESLSKYNEKIMLLSTVAKINKISKLEEQLSYKEFLDKTVRLSNAYKIQSEVRILKEIRKMLLPTISVSDSLRKYSELKNLKNCIEQLKNLDKIKLQVVEFYDNIEKYRSLKKYLEDIKGITDAGRSKQLAKKQAELRVQQLTEQLKKFKVCPLCHQPINEKGA